MLRVECIHKHPNVLGECPIWDFRTGRLLWIDSLQRQIYGLVPETGDLKVWTVGDDIGSIGLRGQGGLVVATRAGFHFLDLESGEMSFVVDPEPDMPATRLNDGKCDRAGRYWCGSMNANFSGPDGSLYCLDTDLTCRKVDGGFTVSNGIAFSPSDDRLYFSDSRVDRSYVYDFDVQTGEVRNRRTFIDTTQYDGRIDGATVDEDGNYWGALFDGWAIGCFSPDGALIRKIEMPVKHPTMCNFGGANLDVLYVTSATFAVAPADLAAQPDAGALFAIYGTGSRGIPEPAFKA